MDSNLDRLDRLFPDVLVLSPEQVGKALGWGRKRSTGLSKPTHFHFRSFGLAI